MEPRRRLTAEQRRVALLQAALTEFGSRGYHATQMEHVAAAGGVSKALLYQHFPSKEELFAAVTGGIVDAFVGSLPEVLARADEPLQAWHDAVALLVDLVQASPESWRLVARYLADPELGVGLREMRASLYEHLAALLVSFYLPGERPLPAEEVRHVAEQTVPLLVGAVSGVLSWWLEHPEVPRAEVVQRTVEFGWLGLDRLRRGETLDRRN